MHTSGSDTSIRIARTRRRDPVRPISVAGAAAQLRRASTHWMRRTGITHSLASGTPMDVEMGIAGHSSIATTSRYTHAETRRRLQESLRFLARLD